MRYRISESAMIGFGALIVFIMLGALSVSLFWAPAVAFADDAVPAGSGVAGGSIDSASGSIDSAGASSGLTELQRLYVDPAMRFTIKLPQGWDKGVDEMTITSTIFYGPAKGEAVFIHVLHPDQGETSAEAFVDSFLDYAKESQEGFTVISDPKPFENAGVQGFLTEYEYLDQDGVDVIEAGLYAQHEGLNYAVQYCAPRDIYDSRREAMMQLFKDFSYGPAPKGGVPALTLRMLGLKEFNDPAGEYMIKVPALWLKTETDNQAESLFVEIGGWGNLQVAAYDIDPADKTTPLEKLQDFTGRGKEEWPGYKLYSEPAALTRDGCPGAITSVGWQDGDGIAWRETIMLVQNGSRGYEAIVLYPESGFGERTNVFDQIMESFTIRQGN
ncbi:MAG: hypothetical protein HPY71_15725 [Firmicutes bacterium]|nr:hypothetical protein [Bacillota bacterium]